MGGTQYQNLLTDDERRVHLHGLLGHRFRMHGQIQLPSLDQYNSLDSSQGLEAVGFEMCRWLGLKPNGLKITYASKAVPSGFAIDSKAKTIIIDPRFMHHPYTSGAMLAMAVVTYVVTHFGHEVPDRAYAEFATIETGLGLWIVNAQPPKVSFRQKLYHLLDSSWFHSEHLTLSAYQPRQYVERVSTYAHDNRVAVDVYLPHVLARCRYLFSSFILNQSSRYLPEASITLRHKKLANTWWLKIALIALILGCGISLGFYALSLSSVQNDPRKAQHQQEISELRKAYDDCQAEAAKQLSSYDPNDLFMTRQVDATKARCQSARNQYNYAVNQYQTNYSRD